jgi:hypothetical protein
MVIPDHVGRLQLLVKDHVVLTYERERRLVMKVLPLAPDLLVRLSEPGSPPCACDDSLSCAARHGVAPS